MSEKSIFERLSAIPQPLPEEPKPVALKAPEVFVPPPNSAVRARCVTDHRFLANDVLEMDSPEEHEVLFNLFPHREPGVIVADSIQDRLILWPRYSGKSTCSAVDIMQAILHDHDTSVLYVTDIDLAKNRLKQIADYFDNPTVEFRKAFPELCGLDQRTATQFTVRGRTNRASIDPTFTITTAASDITGGHFDYIFIDDLVTFNNSRSKEMRDKMHALYRKLRSLRKPNTRVVINGTHYDSDDTYARIRLAVEKEGARTKWLIDVRSCWSYGCANCGHKDLWHHATGECNHHDCDCSHFESDSVRGVLIDQFVTSGGQTLGYTVENLLHEQSEACLGLKDFLLQYENNPSLEATLNLPTFTGDVLDKFFGRE